VLQTVFDTDSTTLKMSTQKEESAKLVSLDSSNVQRQASGMFCFNCGRTQENGGGGKLRKPACAVLKFQSFDNLRSSAPSCDVDGVFGLGLLAYNASSQSSILAKVMSQNFFSLFLANPLHGPLAPNEITFGGYRSERCDGRIQWVSLVSGQAQQWEVGIRQVLLSANNRWPAQPLETHALACPIEHHLCKAALDTQRATIAGPAAYITALLSVLKVDRFCHNFDTLPAVFLELARDGSGASAAYEPIYLQLTRFDYVLRKEKGSRSTCTPLFESLPADMPRTWALGQPLLHRYYTIFDGVEKRIGFALQRRPAVQEVKASRTVSTCHDDEMEMAAWSLPSCAKFAEYGYCHHHKRVAQKSCAATCGLCGKESAVAKGSGMHIVAASVRRLISGDEM